MLLSYRHVARAEPLDTPRRQRSGFRRAPQERHDVHYEIDDDTSRHVLKLGTYGGEAVDSWVLLEGVAA